MHRLLSLLCRPPSHRPRFPQRSLQRQGLALFAGLLLLAVLQLLLRPQPPPCASPADAGCPPEASNPSLDVVCVAAKPSCINAAAIVALNRFVAPRRIAVVTATAAGCAAFSAMAPNVLCLLDSDVVLGVNRSSVAAFLKQRYGLAEDGLHMGRSAAGWYLQQLVKLGIAARIPDLSATFLWWDPDMIATDVMRLRHEASGLDLLNIGGKRIKTYDAAYEQLTGRPLRRAADGSSFVTHAMPVRREALAEMLAAFEGSGEGHGGQQSGGAQLGRQELKRVAGAELGRDGGPAWPWRVLAALNPTQPQLAFSEYASYASWALQRSPPVAAAARRCTWRRHPPGGPIRLLYERMRHTSGRCCPSRQLLASLRARGWQYVGFEVGHIELCGYNSPESADSYGLAAASKALADV